MAKSLSLTDFYRELEADPDLRRLGEYTIIPDKSRAIFPIDIQLEGRDIHLGTGDFRDVFVALSGTHARRFNFGNSQFTELYLDSLKAESVAFSESEASRLYFDGADIGQCHFNRFLAREIYFDWSHVGAIFGEESKAGNVFIGDLQSPGFDPESLRSNTYRITAGVDSTIVDAEKEEGDSPMPEEENVTVLTAEAFLKHVREESDLSRLGKYRVVPKDGTDSLLIHVDLEGKDFNLGDGDFTSMKVLFGGTTARTIDFGRSRFHDVNLQFAQVENAFFADFKGEKVNFGEAKLGNIFWERGSATTVSLDNLRCEQFNINSMKADELRLGSSEVREVYLSVGAGVRKLFCEQARLELLNLHEGKLEEVNLGISKIGRTCINKSTVEGAIHAEGVQTEMLYIGNDGKNTVGELLLGNNADIEHVALNKVFPPGKEGIREILREIKLGTTESEEQREGSVSGESSLG